MNFKDHLNPDQFEAVMAGGGPILVIAGAGSGKTRTLTYRVARLLDDGVRPENILLATFTNKAAGEMLFRVGALTGIDIANLWGGTFHSLANKVLRRYGYVLGYRPGYTILDSDDTEKLVNSCISEMGIDRKTEKFPRGNIIADILGYSLNTGQDIETVVLKRYPYFNYCLEEIIKILALYKKKKLDSNSMDFDDLLFNWKVLLSSYPLVLEEYAGKFRHILVDEYQDTSRVQADIMDLLAARHRNLMVVGDDSQSIYSFRGANYDNILDFPQRYPDSRIIKLETNYRSTPEILHLANRSIDRNERQFHKVLRAVRGSGPRPVLVPAGNVLQQASFVVQRIIELLRDGLPASDIAVLYRAHYHSMEVQMELARRGIPFEIRSGIRFFEQAHIKDLIAYLRIIVNPRDESAWKRVLGLYARVGPKTASKVWKHLCSKEDPIKALFEDGFPAAGGKGAQEGLTKLSAAFRDIVEGSEGLPVSSLIDRVLSNYREFLQHKYTEAASREEDIEQLKGFSTKFGTLGDFLSDLALLTNTAAAGDEASETYLKEDRVVLSTVHQAKGLEWPAVFLIWCSEGMIPLARALKDEDGEEEERRLFYVACTRAKDELYFCYPLMDYSRRMDNGYLSPSRFLEELKISDSRGKAACPYERWGLKEFEI